jgi:hypothetical protein
MALAVGGCCAEPAARIIATSPLRWNTMRSEPLGQRLALRLALRLGAEGGVRTDSIFGFGLQTAN